MWLSLPLVEWYLSKFIIPFVFMVTYFRSFGRWLKIFMLLNYVVSTCDMLYYLQETINNRSQSVEATGDDYFHKPFTTFYSVKPLIAALEDSGLPLNTKENIFLLRCLLCLFSVVYIYVLYRVAKEIIGNTFQRSNNDEWHGRWEKIGQVLKEYSAPVVWKFTPEQIQDPAKVAEYLKEKRCGHSREEQLTALCWALATLYRTLLDTSQSPQGKEEEENRPTCTVATQTAAAPEEQPMLGAVAPKESTSKPQSVCLVRDEKETESSEEEEKPKLSRESRRKVQEIRERFQRPPDRSLLLWLYDCWRLGANVDAFLDSHEAKHLGTLSWNVAVDRRIGRRTGALSLWSRLVSSVREVFSADELIGHRDRWSTKAEGVEYLTELGMVDMLFGEPWNNSYTEVDNPDEVCCSWYTWDVFNKSASPFYAKALSSFTWHSSLKVQKLQAYVWDYTLTHASLLRDSLSRGETQRKECAASSDKPRTICHRKHKLV